jgi:hypothetical protein
MLEQSGSGSSAGSRSGSSNARSWNARPKRCCDRKPLAIGVTTSLQSAAEAFCRKAPDLPAEQGFVCAACMPAAIVFVANSGEARKALRQFRRALDP